ncbi:hypothetical protein [Paracoccus homiensis]|nr:hypothetical protein [Paracoccus homiensis]
MSRLYRIGLLLSVGLMQKTPVPRARQAANGRMVFHEIGKDHLVLSIFR